MLVLLRIIFGFALFSVLAKAIRLAESSPETDGISDAGYLALAVILGIANAVVWAPLVGRLLSDPLTGAFTTGHPGEYKNHVVQFVNKLAARRWRRLAVFFAFLEGVRHPDMPAAFVLGMNNAKSGSLLERIFAREVWRFDNAENCLRAWKILAARGVNLGVHRRPEVNLLVLSVQREVTPPPDTLRISPAPAPPAPARNPQIRLFAGAPDGRPIGASSSAPAAASRSDEPNAAGRAGAIEPTAVPVAGSEAHAPDAVSSAHPPGESVVRPQGEGLSWTDRLKVLLTGRLPNHRE